MWRLREPWRFLTLWAGVGAVAAGWIIWRYFDLGSPPCPGLSCGFTVWGLVFVAGAWAWITGLVLLAWYRPRPLTWIIAIGSGALATIGLVTLSNVVR